MKKFFKKIVMYATIGVIGLTVTHMEQNYTMGSYEVIKGVTNIKDIVDTSNTYEQIYIDDDYEGKVVKCTEKYIVSEKNPKYKAVDGILYSKDGKVLYCYPGGRKDKTYKTMDDVTTLYEKSFSAAKTLESIDLNNVTTVEDEVFYGCGNIKKVSAEKVKSIGKEAFRDCKIKNITFSNNVNMQQQALPSKTVINYGNDFSKIKPCMNASDYWYKIKSAKGYEFKTVVQNPFKLREQIAFKGKVKGITYTKKYIKKHDKIVKKFLYNFSSDKFNSKSIFTSEVFLNEKTKVRAFKYRNKKKIYTKWSNYLDARSVYGSNFN